MAEDELRRWRDELRHRLNEARPDRYLMDERFIEDGDAELLEDADPVDADEDDEVRQEWMLPVIEEMIAAIPDTERIVQMHVEREATRLDGQAQGTANRHIRRMYETRQPDIGWLDLADLPVSVEVREPVWGGEGRIRIRTFRVRMGAMTHADWHAAEVAERRRLGRDYRVRLDGCDARQWFSESQRRAGAESWAEWVEGTAPPADAAES